MQNEITVGNIIEAGTFGAVPGLVAFGATTETALSTILTTLKPFSDDEKVKVILAVAAFFGITEDVQG